MSLKQVLFAVLILIAVLTGVSVQVQAQEIAVSPALPTTLDSVVLEASLACNLIDPPVIDGQTITLTAPGPLRPCSFGFILLFSYPLPPLPPGSYTVRMVTGDVEMTRTVFQVTPAGTRLLVLGQRYEVTATFQNPTSGTPVTETARAVQLSDESGYFWFFDSANVEITAKVLDGRAVNGHLWVFLASMTDVAFTVKIDDLQTPPGCSLPGSTTPCASKSYNALAGKNRNFIDLQAFPSPSPVP